MEYVVELPTEILKTTAGEFLESCTRFAFKIEGKNRGKRGETPVASDCPEIWRLKRVKTTKIIEMVSGWKL